MYAARDFSTKTGHNLNKTMQEADKTFIDPVWDAIVDLSLFSICGEGLQTTAQGGFVVHVVVLNHHLKKQGQFQLSMVSIHKTLRSRSEADVVLKMCLKNIYIKNPQKQERF